MVVVGAGSTRRPADVIGAALRSPPCAIHRVEGGWTHHIGQEKMRPSRQVTTARVFSPESRLNYLATSSAHPTSSQPNLRTAPTGGTKPASSHAWTPVQQTGPDHFRLRVAGLTVPAVSGVRRSRRLGMEPLAEAAALPYQQAPDPAHKQHVQAGNPLPPPCGGARGRCHCG